MSQSVVTGWFDARKQWSADTKDAWVCRDSAQQIRLKTMGSPFDALHVLCRRQGRVHLNGEVIRDMV